MNRRHANLLLCAGLISPTSWATSSKWPSKPIRIIVPLAPGGMSDSVARVTARSMSRYLGQTIVVENRPGAGGNIGAAAVAKADPDGHTLLLLTHFLAVNKTAYRQIGYDVERDFTFIGEIATSTSLLVVNPKLPVGNFADFLAYMKAHPGKVNLAVSGASASPIYLSLATGADFATVMYKGSAPGLTDLLAGQVDAMVLAAETVIPYLKSGALKALAVTSSKNRSSFFPDVPPIAEIVPNFETPVYLGLAAPAATNADAIRALTSALDAARKDPEVLQKFRESAQEVSHFDGKAFGERVSKEVQRWQKVIVAADAYVN